jgi:capsule biosynthesis phosphatase
MRRLVLDIDGTIAGEKSESYSDCPVHPDVVFKINEYKALGFEIVLYTARNMRTYNSNHGKITANTVPVLIEWLDRHSVPYDEIYVGKPWCGAEGFYVDDRAVRPDEFIHKTIDEIQEMLGFSSNLLRSIRAKSAG